MNDPEAARPPPCLSVPNRQIHVDTPTRRDVSRSRDRRRRRPTYSRRPQEFYWLWIAATATYGVGDIVSTIAFLEYVPTIDEANPVVALALDSFGLGGLVVLKIAVYLIMVWISVTGAREGDGLLYYFPPVLLTLVGTYLTASNVRLLLLA
ncbi:hypothetical protein C471_15252 [Halorubrum saccharovorum DSM 1137]|uniref:DUF5658 domain-containing protein n=1 Tax=Halorubrum saccharovorum DSM 1137 TaxID=1227484 RepID=M0DMY0_9EURY|nr:hypothetical protein C471_15252 [Halorubrum saccharovorum DSM 1137]